MRNRDLRRQGITEIDVDGSDAVARALDDGAGVLLFSNHSFHYDSYVLIEAGLRGGWCGHFMTAWQVFALTGRGGRWLLQKHGCFSINREGTDTQAFRQAVAVLVTDPHPLIVYPEGDIYHSNDRVMPFREGAAAIALSARKKATRPIQAIPCAMKCFYTLDPTDELVETMNRLESHIRWRPRPDLPLLERIYRFGSGFLALKEVEYVGRPQTGSIPERLRILAELILTRIEDRHRISRRGTTVGERIRQLRASLIKSMEEIDRSRLGRSRLGKRKRSKPPAGAAMPSPGVVADGGQDKASPARLTSEESKRLKELQQDMEDIFFVTQLSSYHGDYSAEKPTIERMAETIDKFEEDLFALQSPRPRGRRKAIVRFGEPIDVSQSNRNTAELTAEMERRVQQLLNEINHGDEPG
jgi:1-acyl-sn-glycerol-3-phosphate acyltransferase